MLPKDSFANPVFNEDKNINLILLDNNDMDILKNDISNYINLIDNTLLPNTSFDISNNLNDNYEFLTKFAISFILDNRDYYEIVVGDEYTYVDEYNNEFTTNEYVDVNIIYEITDKIFGVEYYYILSDYIEVENDMIPLLKLEEYSLDLNIDKIIHIDKNSEYLDVIIKYEDNNLNYVYTFEYADDSRLVISNLSIKE